VPIAVIELDFDPVLRLGQVAVRLETVTLALVAFIGLVLTAWIAGRTPTEGDDPSPFVQRARLRRDDLLYVVLSVIPGAVLGGRIAYGLLHLDYYVANPLALLDPAQGSLELVGAVVGGACAGASTAHLLLGPVGRWFHVATLPLLVCLSLDKLATALGGAGQGRPTDVAWATAYTGQGPWATLAPAMPSHPSQLYEAAATGGVVVIVVAILVAGGFSRRDGRVFLAALALWALARAVVAATWRDAAVLGPLNAGQLIAISAALVAIGLAVSMPRVQARLARASTNEPTWPDPATRPQF
jgi:prolipoprotein diacylglyceryltransferase